MSTNIKRLALATLLAGLVGCHNKNDNPKDPAVDPPTKHTVGRPKANDGALPGNVAALHKSFKEATSPEPPEDQGPPAATTTTGKNVAQLHTQIAGVDGRGGVWDQIRFVPPEGKRIRYRATLETDAGNIELEFFPEQAPSHVRNFLALAKVGYYDGLAVDQILNSQIDVSTGEEKKFASWTCMVAGCPLGTGEVGRGHIGYWLLPEISEKLSHEVGSVGLWHDESLESGGSKFYITLTKAPWLDGAYTIFARISQGLDVAQKIGQLPVQDDNRPRQPVILRKVVIHQSIEDVQVVARTE